MQDKEKWFPKLYLQLLQPSPMRQTTSRFTAWQRAAGTGALALLMVAAFGTNAFAKGVPVKNDGVPAVQQEGTPVGAEMGVVVVAIDEEGPAALGGIVRGDILLTAGGEPVASAAVLYGIVMGSQPGDELALDVQHGDELRKIIVPLGQTEDRAYLGVQVVDPPGVAVAVEVPAPVEMEPGVDQEVVTATVTVEGGEAATGDVGAGSEIIVPSPGLIVVEVMADGPAAMAGVMAGDLIVAVDRQPVATADDMINALKGHTPGEVALLTVQKGGPVGAVITEIPVLLGAAPDDPSRAYLGMQLVAAPSDVTIEMLPPSQEFTAPAMPVPYPVTALPETIMGYSYPGAYPGAYGAGSCGTQIFQYFYPPMQQWVPISAVPFTDLPYSVAPFTAPLPPMVSARPMGPAAPFFIYHSEVNPVVNPEIYSQGYTYGATGMAGENVIFYHAAPMVATYPATPVTGAAQQDVVIVKAQTQPAWTVALPPVTTEPAEVMKSITVQLLPDGSTIQSVPAQVMPFDPAAAGVAAPQMAQPAAPVPSAADDWF